MRDVNGYLSAQAEKWSANQEVADLWQELLQLYSKRLWHQATQVLLQLVARSELQSSDQLWQLYTNVIADFELKLNPLSLIELCTPIVHRLIEEDSEDALQFLEKLGDKVKAHNAAFVMSKILVGRIYLQHLKDIQRTKTLLEDTEALLNEIEGVGIVHGRFYMLQSELCMIEGDHAGYYRAALHYLGCTNMSQLGVDEQRKSAFNLALAALLAKDIYNFGELLAHPVLESLTGTGQEWIIRLLKAFNSGDVKTFTQEKATWASQSDLRENEAVLHEKICLLALMEMTFRRSANDRQLDFAEVAQETGLASDMVELLVMKCLAKGLVKGTIDQVSEKVELTWVQPRVLDKDQLKTVQNKITALSASITVVENLIENTAGEILTM